MNITKYLSSVLNTLNNSRYFSGLAMLMLNVGSRFITINLSKTHEEYIRNTIGRELLLFSMLFIGTKDVITSLILTAVFIFLTDHIFNELSPLCVIPHKYRQLNRVIDSNKDGIISEIEIDNAISVLHKAKKQNTILIENNRLENFKNNL
jgi:hypothetical protein